VLAITASSAYVTALISNYAASDHAAISRRSRSANRSMIGRISSRIDASSDGLGCHVVADAGAIVVLMTGLLAVVMR
jgi:hypothetical protein